MSNPLLETVINLMDQKLSAMVILNLPKLKSSHHPLYTEPTMVDGVKLFLSTIWSTPEMMVDYTLPRLKLDDPSFEYLHKVPLTCIHGSTELYALPLLVYASQLPDYCNRNNVQNYSAFNEMGQKSLHERLIGAEIKYGEDEVYKTLRSVGLPPKNLFSFLTGRFNRLGVTIPGNDHIGFFMSMFNVQVVTLKDFLEYVSAIKELPANNINFILNGPERNRTIRLIELVVGDGFIDYIEDIINRMYYILYKSWFDDSSFIMVGSSRVHVAHHSVWAAMLDIRDLTIHPSIQLASLIERMAIDIANDKSNSTYPEDFKSFIPEDENARQLMNTVELKSEGAYMHHCVGGKSYQAYLQKGFQIFFHLNIPDSYHGGTLSMQRYSFGDFTDAFRIKGVETNEWWRVDQYYGYNDERLVNSRQAMFEQANFINKHFDKLTSAQYAEIKDNRSEYTKIVKAATSGQRWLLDAMLGWNDEFNPHQEAAIAATATVERFRDLAYQMPRIEGVGNPDQYIGWPELELPSRRSVTAQLPHPIIDLPAVPGLLNFNMHTTHRDLVLDDLRLRFTP